MVRPCFTGLKGEHPEQIVASVIRALTRGQAAGCTSNEQIRDAPHVDDLALAFVALLDCDAHCVVNIGSGRPLAIRDLVSRIADKIGNADLLRLGARMLRANELPLPVTDVCRMRKLGLRRIWDLVMGVDITIA